MEANIELFYRYKGLIEQAEGNGISEHIDSASIGFSHLKNMCEVAIESISKEDWPVDKQSRWLGYVQCGVIVQGLTTIDDERNYSRDLFHSYYRKEGIKIPDTIGLNKSQ